MAKLQTESPYPIFTQQIKQLVAEKQFTEAVWQLTFLAHQNLHLLQQCIEDIKNDSTITNREFLLQIALLEIEQMLNEQKIEEAEVVIENTIAQCNAINSTQTLVIAQLQKVVLCAFLQKKDEAYILFEQCEALAQSINNVETDIQLAVYGYHFYSESNTNKAGEYIYRALDLAIRHKHVYWQAYSLMHLGTLNTILSNHNAALNFFTESFVLLQQLQLNISMADNLMCQFNIFYRLKEFDKAIACLNQAITLSENCGWEHKIAICYGNLSTVYLQLSKFEEAKQAAEKDIEISHKLNNKFNVGTATYRLGRIETALGNTNSAIQLFNESIELRKNRISNNQLVQVYYYMLELYAKSGDYKKAFEVQSDFIRLKLEILNTEKTKENEALRIKYETEKREAELREARLQHTESELKALKAQMNPHFIFNALNSIQEIFFLGDKRLANKHLARFSQLMRNILSASGKKTITLKEEIVMLDEYLALEALRFGTSFQYNIETNENVDEHTLEVPPMIIQPFVENAVKHGLMHKEGSKTIELNFTFNEAKNILEVMVADNGIGRKASAIINQRRNNHNSFSTSATQKRFDILNQLTTQKFSFKYLDEDALEAGTKVLITLPTDN